MLYVLLFFIVYYVKIIKRKLYFKTCGCVLYECCMNVGHEHVSNRMTILQNEVSRYHKF